VSYNNNTHPPENMKIFSAHPPGASKIAPFFILIF